MRELHTGHNGPNEAEGHTSREMYMHNAAATKRQTRELRAEHTEDPSVTATLYEKQDVRDMMCGGTKSQGAVKLWGGG